MLYKVTPAMPSDEGQGKAKNAREPGQPRIRKKRRSAIFDHEGNEVLITLMCLKCRQIKPLMQFGLRKMADGAIRNQPWCRTCRSGAGTPKPKPQPAQAPVEAANVLAAAPLPAAAAVAIAIAPEAEPPRVIEVAMAEPARANEPEHGEAGAGFAPADPPPVG